MLLVVLCLCMIAMCVYVYVRENKDVFAPSLLFLISYVVAVVCAMVNIKRWGIELSPLTFAVLLVGAIEFEVISIGIDRYYKKLTILPRNTATTENITEEITISVWKQVLTYLGCIVYCILFYRQVKIIASGVGEYRQFSEMIRFFKDATSVYLTASVPGWLGQIERIVMICAYIYLYVFLHNIIRVKRESIAEKLKKNICLLIPFWLYMANAVLNSDRLMMLQLLIAGIVLAFLLWTYRTGKKYISLKSLMLLGAMGCIGLLLFSLSAGVFGRITDKGLIEYITYYCGCGIECLNQFLKEPPVASDIWGKETFYNLNLKLYNLGFLDMDQFYPIHLESRYYGDVLLGNVYTAYRRWIYDFGFGGAVLLQGAMATFMSVFYNQIKHQKFKNNGFWMIVYAYLAYTLVFHAYDGYIYIQYVSQTGVTTFVLFGLAYWFFTKLEVNLKGGFFITVTDKIHIGGSNYQ